MSDNPPFLKQQEPRLSTKESTTIVDHILKRLNIKLAVKDRHNQLVIKSQGTPKEQAMKYSELVQQVKNTGICGFIQTELDNKDSVFGGTFGMATPNWQMKMTTEWAGYKKELSGPCRTVPSEIDISEDIEFYKQETCIESTDYGFEMCVRNYRGYLFSCIGLIDCYINRHIVLFDFKELKSPNFLRLKESRNTEERLEIFIDEFCNFPFAEFKQSISWDNFKKLKYLRNEVVHSLHPYMGIGLKEMALNLNLSIQSKHARLPEYTGCTFFE